MSAERKSNKKGVAIRHKKFWEDNERFADLFNTVIFNGKNVIIPEELQELDTDVSGVIEHRNKERTITRMRDVFKLCANGTRLIALGVENQTEVHYVMPLRTLLYDVIEYVDQVTSLSKIRQKEKGITSAEFLSGMRKEDRLSPTITIVIYYGEEPWDGPISLKDMIADVGIGAEWCLTDHKMYLVQVCNQEEYHFKNQDVEEVFSISQAMFQGGIEKAKEQYGTRKLSKDVADMITSITGTNHVLEHEEGGVIMCKKVDEWVERNLREMEESVTKKVIKEVTERVTGEVTERVTGEVTERVTGEVTERVTGEVTERVTGEVTEQITAKAVRGAVALLEELNYTIEEMYEPLKKRFLFTEEQIMKYI